MRKTADITKYMYGHVTCMRERRDSYRVLVGKLETENLERLDIDGRIVLKCIFKKWDRGHRLD